MTVVWIEYNGAVFERHFKKVHTRSCSFKEKNVVVFFFFKILQLRWQTIIVDIVHLLMLLPANS